MNNVQGRVPEEYDKDRTRKTIFSFLANTSRLSIARICYGLNSSSFLCSLPYMDARDEIINLSETTKDSNRRMDNDEKTKMASMMFLLN